MSGAPTSAAGALVATLARHGADRVFCVPGESYLAVLDALHDAPAIQVVTCRHESGAGFMAVADAKLTGRPGIVFVSRSPGASNATVSVYTARDDAVPLILFIGQVPRRDRGRGAFQEADYDRVFGSVAKWVTEIGDPDRVAATVAEAWRRACSGTPGPVVVALPEDMQRDATAETVAAPLALAATAPQPADVAAVAERLASAERPLLIAGSGASGAAARQALAACSEAWRIPVAVSFKHQDLFTNRHPNFAGHLGYGLPARIAETLGDADLVVAVGTRLGDVTTQSYRLPTAPTPAQPLVHVHADEAQIGRVFDTALGIVADAAPFLSALAERNAPEALPGRGAWIERLHGLYADLARWEPTEAPDGVDFGHVVAALAEALPEDGILATDAGNFGGWVHRYFPFRATQALLGAASGSMGLGVPAAVAAALRCPERTVAGVVGDGGFLMTGNELATAVRHRLRLALFVSNNASYGTIRLHQEKAFPGRTIGTDLANPDFARLAEAFGARGLSIRTPAEVGPVVREALAADGPVVVDVKTSLEHISAYTTLEKLAAGVVK